jgi:hypothetical protein
MMNVASPFRLKPRIDAAESERRRKAVDFARGSIRFEGGVLSSEVETLNDRFIAGELSDEEHTAAILALYAVN